MKVNRSVHVLVVILTFGVALGIWNPLSRKANDLLAQAATTSKLFQVDPFWPKPLPNDWITGNVGGTCVDSKDHVFIVNRTADADNFTAKDKEMGHPAPPVIEFDPEGNVVNSWGDPKVVPTGIHDCYVDYEGNIWIGGNKDGIAQKYTPTGKLLIQIGEKGKFDSDNGKVDGKPLNSSKTQLYRPSSFAVDPANGDVYITDGYGNKRVVVFDRNGKYIRQFGHPATKEESAQGVGGAFADVVHHVSMSNDGLLYVCDREGFRIQVFDKQGNFKKNMTIPRRRSDLPGNAEPYWTLLSRDKEQKYIFVASGDEAIFTLERATGKVIDGFGIMGHMAGNFTFLHSMAINSKNELFTGETIGGRRIQKFKLIGKLP